MKRVMLFLLALGLLQAAVAQNKPDNTPEDRQIKGLLILGMNLTQVDGDEVYGYYKAGLNAGVGALLPLGKGFGFNVETLFSQKGAYKKFDPAGTDSLGRPYYQVKLDYLEVPVLFSYEDKHIFTVGLGASWGRRVNYREVEHGLVMDSSARFSKNDWNVLVDVQLRVWKHLKFDVRYAYSMAKIRTRNYGPTLSGATWTRDQYNNILTFRAIYLLNEKYEPQPKKKKRQNKSQTSVSTAPWTL